MTQAERDLVAALRGELAAIAPSRACDRRAEAAGLADPGGRRHRTGTALARLEIRLAKRGDSPSAESAPFDWDAAPDHCRWAWLRGVFLARGSLSLSSGRTHLEFVLDPPAARVLAERLAGVGLPATVRTRRDRGVVTWKSGDRVGTFLRGVGAGSALLELEVRQVARSMRGDLNRVLNAESANLQRAVLAAGRQLAAIETLEVDGRLGLQPPSVRAVAAARRETPEATLAELAARLELTRSTVQRALERLERLAEHPDDGGDAGDDRTAAGDLNGSGMIPRRCARSSSPRTGRCTPRRGTPARLRP
jgi:hypothetical protein